MADKNFTQFDLKTTLSLNDFLVGYNENGSNEIRTKISDINSFVLDKQTLSFNESNKNLTLSNGKFASLSSIDLTIIKGETYSGNADYFLQITDYNKLLTFDNYELTNVIIPKDLKIPIGTELKIMRKGNGNVALSASNGVILRSVDDSVFVKYKNSVVNLLKLDENDWLLHGELSKFPTTPIPLISIVTDNQTVDLTNIQNYIVVDNSAVSTFNLTFDGVDGLTFTDVYDENNYSNCKLTISTTANISANKNELFVTSYVNLSTIGDKLFTFYYFNTGSLILGTSPSNSPLPAPPKIVVNNNINGNGLNTMYNYLMSPFLYESDLISNKDSFSLWSATNNYFFEV
jgi:hypothetical protein